MTNSVSARRTASHGAPRAVDAILSEPWAILQDNLDQILAIAERELAEIDIEALEARIGRRLENGQVTAVRDGVAIVPVTGPIFRRANLLTRISGATSIDVLATDITTALEDPAVKAVVLNIDSPGGQMNGNNELAKMIAASRGLKPIVAYVGGAGASAAYWIASAAERIVVDETAALGSIGVLLALPRGRGDGPIEFVSSNAPKKRPDIASDAGRAQVQALADKLGRVFAESVAANRGLPVERIEAEFGQGDLLIGADAVAAGMADAIGSLESVIAALAQGDDRRSRTPGPSGPLLKDSATMTHTPAAAPAADAGQPTDTGTDTGATPAVPAAPPQAAIQAAVDAERARILAIDEATMPGFEAMALAAKADGTPAPVFAQRVLAEQKRRIGQVAEQLKAETPAMPAAPPAAPAASTEAATAAPRDSLPLDERCKAAWEKDEAVRAEFVSFDDYKAFAKAQAEGRVKIRGKAAA